MSHTHQHRHHDHVATPAAHPEPAPRRSAAAREAGTGHADPHTGATGFHDAINAGLGSPHHARAMIGAVVGRATVHGGPLGSRASDQTLTTRTELSPAAGLPDLAAARSVAASHAGTLVAIVRTHDGKFRVFDTGFILPQLGDSVARVELTAISRSGVYDVIDWGRVDLAPHPNLVQPEPALRSTDSPASREFERHNSGLGRERLGQICAAVDQMLGNDVELRNAFYTNFTRHSLGIANPIEIEHMERYGFEAMANELGNTVLLPEVLDHPPARLVALLLHEMMHGRANHPMTSTTGNPVQEGEAYAVQYFVVEHANGSQQERDRLLQIVISGGGEVAAGVIPQVGIAFNRTYAALVALQQIIDHRFPHTDAPFAYMSSLRAGELMAELATDVNHSPELAQVLAWTADNLGRFTLPRRSATSRSS